MKFLGLALIVLGLLLAQVYSPSIGPYTLIAGAVIHVLGLGITAWAFYSKRRQAKK